MKIFHSIIIVILFILTVKAFSGCSSVNKSNDGTIQEISFTEKWDTVRVLDNPHKGWYHHMLDNGIGKYLIQDEELFHSFSAMDHLYLRLAWAYLEPEEDVYNWQVIDTIIDKYVPLGYGISFRISCKETGWVPNSIPVEIDGVGYATPPWVREAGAKGIVPDKYGPPIWTPDWDDPVYLKKLDNFHKAFAERYDGKPWLRYVDVGSIGEWGEGNAHRSTNIAPTVEEVKANIDIYLKNYKHSQIVATDALLFWGKPESEAEELYDYAVSHGITLRDDSPMVSGHMERFRDNWSISHPHFYDPLYLEKPIILELQHYGHVKNDGHWMGKNGADTIPSLGVPGAEFFRKSVEIMHATYIGYHGYVEEWLADNPDLTKELANRCGYWYFPVKASFPSILNRGDNELSIVWYNKGVAPAYNAFDLILRFESENSKNSFDLEVNSGNKNWLPGISKTEKYKIDIPSKAKKGNYTMKFMLAEKTGQKIRPIQIGVKESIIDAYEFVEFGLVTLR